MKYIVIATKGTNTAHISCKTKDSAEANARGLSFIYPEVIIKEVEGDKCLNITKIKSLTK